MTKSMKPARSLPSHGDSFEAVVTRRLARRSFLKTGLAAVPALAVTPSLLGRSAKAETASLTFQPVPLAIQDRIVVPAGYESQTLIRWGDPLFENAPEFDPLNQTADRQRLQCGYNCDFLAFFPLPLGGRVNSRRGLLTINHEFTNPELMFPNYSPANTTKQIVDVELAAHGLTVVEIVRKNDTWTYSRRSPLNRRLTAETPMKITGPAAGHPLLKTSYDPAGSFVFGSLNNCSGGVTPWGTLLTAEENFNQYFANAGSVPSSDPRAANHARYGLPNAASDRRWELFHSRFDLSKEPNEAFRFGWVIEVDPYDPSSVPRKRTALGRMKHEAAQTTLSKNGLAVVYTGDDERFEYLYKFVSRKKFKRNNREANLNLLDDGLLLVAKFNDDGTGEWRPMVGGSGPLASLSHEEVLINTRAASDLAGGTRMDRPEDVEMNPVNGKVYAVFTNNTQRGTSGRPAIDGPNPRANNRHGHIIEITETDDDAAARTFTWEIFMLCGDPANSADATFFSGFNPAQISPISSPDNIAFDPRGNLWIATDGQPGTLQKNDGIYAVPVEGSDRGFLRQFLSAVIGSETASLLFSPNGDSLFVSIQHPGEGTGSTFLNPSSLFPDGTAPPRPTVIAVTRSGSDILAGPIGS